MDVYTAPEAVEPPFAALPRYCPSTPFYNLESFCRCVLDEV